MFTNAEAKRISREKLFTSRRARGFKRCSIWFVRRMRRQGEIRGEVCSHPEGQEVSGKNRVRMFAGCGGKGKYAIRNLRTPKGGMCQESIASNCSERSTQAKDARSLFQVSLSAQNIFFYVQVFESAEHLAIRNLHPPKGRRFQENIALICSERPTQAKVSRSLSLASPSAQNIFFLFVCKFLKM